MYICEDTLGETQHWACFISHGRTVQRMKSADAARMYRFRRRPAALKKVFPFNTTHWLLTLLALNSSPLLCFGTVGFHLLRTVPEYTWTVLKSKVVSSMDRRTVPEYSTERSHLSNELDFGVKCTRIRAQVPDVKAPEKSFGIILCHHLSNIEHTEPNYLSYLN